MRNVECEPRGRDGEELVRVRVPRRLQFSGIQIVYFTESCRKPGVIPVSILLFTFGQMKLWSNKLSSSKSYWICVLCSFNLTVDVQRRMMEQLGNICGVGNSARAVPEAYH